MSENKVVGKRTVCQWCNKSKLFLFDNYVCFDCYKLLAVAGVAEEDIFNQNKNDNNPRQLEFI